MPKILTKKYFERPTLQVARELIGCTLVRKYRGKIIRGIITETEAYIGPRDLASHASRGRTPRTEIMFGEATRIYVYLVYGMYYCINIVTEEKDFPAAVLIRGVKIGDLHLDGPGKLTCYLHIDKKLNAKKLIKKSGLWIEKGIGNDKFKIKRGPRIGVDYAGTWAKKPWRFYIENL